MTKPPRALSRADSVPPFFAVTSRPGWCFLSWRLALIFVICALGPVARTFGVDPSDPGIDLLLQKGIITEEEAAKAKAAAETIRLQNEQNQTNEMQMPPVPESKWKISPAIKNITLFGDIRVRYEDREAKDPYGDKIELQRFRYAVRVGLRGDALDDFYYGLRLETSANPRSPWVTLSSATSGTPYQGPFGKSADTIAIGQVYLGWHPESWVNITVGKMPNPLYTTPMVWDTDLNPEGLAERFTYTVGQADLFATFGQFLYQDTNPEDESGSLLGLGLGADQNTLPFLLAWQLGLNYHATRKINFKVAPVLYDYVGFASTPYTVANSGTTPGFSGTYIGQGTTLGPDGLPAGYNLASANPYSSDGFFANQTGVNDLLVLEVPMELNVEVNNFDIQGFGDFAYNFEGTDRANAAYVASQNLEAALAGTASGTEGFAPISSPQTHENKAYQVGLAIGNKNSLGMVYGTTSRKHGWELRTYWQHVEQYALDPNLIDSDFFEGRENLQGIYVALAYGFTDNVLGTVRYGHASRINKNLGTGGSNQDIPQINPINDYDLFQLDLTFRF